MYSHILKAMKSIGNDRLTDEKEISDAVIAIPCHYDEHQKNVVLKAAKSAGVNVVKLLEEPIAAAVGYGFGWDSQPKPKEDDKFKIPQKDMSNALLGIYDLGGDRFTFTVLELKSNNFRIVASKSLDFFGGNKFDKVLVHYIIDHFKTETNIDLTNDNLANTRILELSESVKNELSTLQKREVNAPYIAADATGPKHINMEISRFQLEKLYNDLIQETLKPIDSVFDELKGDIKKEDLTDILLVGGMTKMPRIQSVLEKYFNNKKCYVNVDTSINNDEVISIGSVKYSQIFGDTLEDTKKVSVMPISLGIETYGGLFERIITKGNPYPLTNKSIFQYAFNHQMGINVKVYKGERDFVRHNKFIGHLDLNNVDNGNKDSSNVEVCMNVDDDLNLSVTLTDLNTGKSSIRKDLVFNNDLTPEELDKISEEYETFKESDKKFRDKYLLLNESDIIIWQLEYQLLDENIKNNISDELYQLLLDNIQNIRDIRNPSDGNESSIDLDKLKDSILNLNTLLDRMSKELSEQNDGNESDSNDEKDENESENVSTTQEKVM